MDNKKDLYIQLGGGFLLMAIALFVFFEHILFVLLATIGIAAVAVGVFLMFDALMELGGYE